MVFSGMMVEGLFGLELPVVMSVMCLPQTVESD